MIFSAIDMCICLHVFTCACSISQLLFKKNSLVELCIIWLALYVSHAPSAFSPHAKRKKCTTIWLVLEKNVDMILFFARGCPDIFKFQMSEDSVLPFS